MTECICLLEEIICSLGCFDENIIKHNTLKNYKVMISIVQSRTRIDTGSALKAFWYVQLGKYTERQKKLITSLERHSLKYTASKLITKITLLEIILSTPYIHYDAHLN